MGTDTVTIAQFIADNAISINSKWTDRNPIMESSHDMDHWKVTLSCRGEIKSGFDTFHGYKGKLGERQYTRNRMTLTFSKGHGHHGAEPTIAEVLDCLASDAAGIENGGNFEDWCSEYGYDADSRKALKTFKACEHQSKRLQSFLGGDLYQQLLWNVERE